MKKSGWLFGDEGKRNLIELEKDDDRCISIDVKDQYGEVYHIGLEFLNHGFQSDEVQIICVKRGTRKGCENHIYSANRILHNEKTVDEKSDNNSLLRTNSVWFEFHEIENENGVNLKPVLSDK